MKYWKQCAEMLGVELEEEFVLIKPDGKRTNDEVHKFTENGMYYKGTTVKTWRGEPSATLWLILNGAYKPVSKPWKPEIGEQYWHYSEGWKEGAINQWQDDLFDLIMWKAGNCFRTKKEAEEKGKEALEQLRKEFEES